MEPTNAKDSWKWKGTVNIRQLYTMRRCKCPELKARLEILRHAKPDKNQLLFILKGHRAPASNREFGRHMPEEPSISDVSQILKDTPHTLFLTVSRKACAALNQLAQEALFQGCDTLDFEGEGFMPTDPESNRDNYVGNRMIEKNPGKTWIYKGIE